MIGKSIIKKWWYVVILFLFGTQRKYVWKDTEKMGDNVVQIFKMWKEKITVLTIMEK